MGARRQCLLGLIGLALAACGGGRERVAATRSSCAGSTSETAGLAASAHRHRQQSDFRAAARLFTSAAHRADGCAADPQPCPYWNEAAASAFLVQDDDLLEAATSGFLACLKAHPTYVPEADERIVLAVVAARTGVDSPFGLPSDAQRLEMLIQSARAAAAAETPEEER